MLAVRLSRPQRQLIVPRGKPGRDHDEASELICDRSIIRLAVAQQFHSGAWCSSASDNCVTRSPNERNVEGRHDFIAAVRRAGRNHCGGRGSGFNWRLLFAWEAEDKCRTTCCSKREKREGYAAYRYGGHGTQPVAKSLARQCPLNHGAPISPGNQVGAPGSMLPAKQPRDSLAKLAADALGSSRVASLLRNVLNRLARRWSESLLLRSE